MGATLLVGLHLWLGFTATVGLTNNRFSGKPLSLWGIDAGHQMGSFVLMAIVLALWPQKRDSPTGQFLAQLADEGFDLGQLEGIL